MANLLLESLRNTKTSPTEATDACKHLLQLQVEGSPCMEHCDPIQLYLTTQVGALIRGCWELIRQSVVQRPAALPLRQLHLTPQANMRRCIGILIMQYVKRVRKGAVWALRSIADGVRGFARDTF